MKTYPIADDLMKAGKFCAAISRFEYRTDIANSKSLRRGGVPYENEPTATVTFIEYEKRTYAFTAKHVVDILDKLDISEGKASKGYFCPNKKGVAILGPFITPKAGYLEKAVDIAICPIDSKLPEYIGKVAYKFSECDDNSSSISHALAVGFPTISKKDIEKNGQTRLSMQCVHALAEDVGGSLDSDQMQFFSEIENAPEHSDLSGMSGGPVFWSKDDDSFGLIGFVKEAMNVVPPEGEENLYSDPRVHFLCQRSSYATLSSWIQYVDENWQTARDETNSKIQN